jgi:hypothetical protein
MKTTELTVQLPEDEARILETYAKEHALSLSELLARFAQRLRSAPGAPHPADIQFTGAIPTNLNAREEHRQHLERKHR